MNATTKKSVFAISVIKNKVKVLEQECYSVNGLFLQFAL
jgi:hypothetical protein